MSDATGIVAAVEADPTLRTLIGGRIYPSVLPPQATLPALTYELVSQPPGPNTQEGAKYRWPRWRIRIVSERHADLEPIAAAIAGVFESPSGTSPFRSAWLDGTTESREPTTNRYWRLIDVLGFQPAGGFQ